MNPEKARADAHAELVSRLAGLGIEFAEAHQFANEYLADLVAHGWRPRALSVVTEVDIDTGPKAEKVPDAVAEARAKIHAAKERYATERRALKGTPTDTEETP